MFKVQYIWMYKHMHYVKIICSKEALKELPWYTQGIPLW
jgi:hypothetical protein